VTRGPAPESGSGAAVRVDRAAIERTYGLIRPYIRTTPVVDASGADFGLAAIPLVLKLELFQHAGSFKTRGAFANLLTRAIPAVGVVAASGGNHGAAVAYASAQLRCRARIVVPEGANPGKLSAIQALGGELEVHGSDSGLAESYARGRAEAEGSTYVSPYNDADVIAGQGTLGVELTRSGALDRADALFVALGGGGLLSGVAAWLKERWPRLHIVGCSPENSAVMIGSLAAGRILELPSRPTLSDGTAGGMEPDAITFPLCQALGDEWLTVTETEILQAMRLLRDTHGMLVEGAAGVAMAGYLRQAARWRGSAAIVILCGGNVDPGVLDG